MDNVFPTQQTFFFFQLYCKSIFGSASKDQFSNSSLHRARKYIKMSE